MGQKSRYLCIVSHSISVKEFMNSNIYFKSKIHLLPELTVYITFKSIETLYIACKSEDI